ncbi:MAG TPA: glutathione S-transferase N-terminal domain-containing protein, partial [Rudaea sp.]|nr:glutathione S-transferase N-terminal domain-containing protein [Rudaea sp.]
MAAVGLKLYSYWRSSACYRVRIALNLKGLAYEQASVHLANSEQHAEEFGAVNPQQLVPVLIDG